MVIRQPAAVVADIFQKLVELIALQLGRGGIDLLLDVQEFEEPPNPARLFVFRFGFGLDHGHAPWQERLYADRRFDSSVSTFVILGLIGVSIRPLSSISYTSGLESTNSRYSATSWTACF